MSALKSAADKWVYSLIQPAQGGPSVPSAPPLNSHGPYRLLGFPIMSSFTCSQGLVQGQCRFLMDPVSLQGALLSSRDICRIPLETFLVVSVVQERIMLLTSRR